jgi:hypothetical protein
MPAIIRLKLYISTLCGRIKEGKGMPGSSGICSSLIKISVFAGQLAAAAGALPVCSRPVKNPARKMIPDRRRQMA